MDINVIPFTLEELLDDIDIQAVSPIQNGLTLEDKVINDQANHEIRNEFDANKIMQKNKGSEFEYNADMLIDAEELQKKLEQSTTPLPKTEILNHESIDDEKCKENDIWSTYGDR
tara:strand:+ start:33469 stop:33813 length:345 start_codon:yes stop_codon:yes gene_type:complete